MKRFLLSVTLVITTFCVNAQSMLEKGQSGVALSGNTTLSEYSEGLGVGFGYTFNGIFDLGAVAGRTYAKTNQGHFNSDIYENYWGLECAIWFLNKELSSEAFIKTGLLGGVAFGKYNENAWMYYSEIKTVQGYGGLELLFNYNPDNDFFNFQPYVSACYMEGKEKHYTGDYMASVYLSSDWMFSAGVCFGFKFISGDALSLSISKSYFKDADISTLGFGIQYEIPTGN